MGGRFAAVAAAAMLYVCIATVVAAAQAPAPAPTVASALEGDLTQYLAARGTAEHISAASLSVSLPNGRFIDVAAGTTSFGGGSPVTPSNLFQIGSNTKAFTGTLVLLLQRQGLLSTADTLGKWLPQYAAWKNVTIRQMLDMTSGLATYDGTQAWEKAMSADPDRDFSPQQLVAFVDQSAPLAKGWLYSNTGYILTQMIVEKAAGQTYAAALRSRVIAPTGIADLYYYPNAYPQALLARTVDGYYYNDSPGDAGLAPLLGKSVRTHSISWTQAAGGIVATPHALARWARELYRGPILTAAERAQMETLVSTADGRPLARVDAEHPRGFGLGVTEIYKPGLGTFWFYEGETLGYRMVHAYFPKQNVIVAVGLNSQTRPDQDRVGQLVAAVVKTLGQHGLF